MSRKIRKFRTDKFDSETNGNFDSCNSCKRFPFVSRIKFIRSKPSNFSAHVYGVSACSSPIRHHSRVAHIPSGGEIQQASTRPILRRSSSAGHSAERPCAKSLRYSSPPIRFRRGRRGGGGVTGPGAVLWVVIRPAGQPSSPQADR